MKFKKNSKIIYSGHILKLLGKSGIIIRVCGYDTNCRIVKFIGGYTCHVNIRDLKNNEKGQLTFDFYHRI